MEELTVCNHNLKSKQNNFANSLKKNYNLIEFTFIPLERPVTKW